MRLIEYRVSGGEAGVRLQDYLADRMQLSKRRAKALLDARNVYVDGQRVWMAGHKLPAGAVVGVLGGTAATVARAAEIPLLYTDGDYLVADKPAGLLTNGEDSLESRLQATRGEPALTAAHRLDRDTSGCVLLARSQVAFDAAVAVFRAHQVTKEYRAIVRGRLQPATQTIDRPIEGQPAITRVRTVSANSQASYLAIQTLTGRTHQIRVHLAAVKHPILGDRQHGQQRGLGPDHMQIPRQMLHALSLRLMSPASGNEISVSARLPDDFRQCLLTFGLRENPPARK